MKAINRQEQQGATLIVVLLLLVIMIALAVSVATNSSTHAMVANNNVLKSQAFQAASSGSDMLLALFNADSTQISKIKEKLCTGPLKDQYTNTANIMKPTEAKDKRKITLQWYACSPTDKLGNLVKPNDCPSGSDCFGVIITGVACPSGAKIDDNLTKASCVISRHLQGFSSVTSGS